MNENRSLFCQPSEARVAIDPAREAEPKNERGINRHKSRKRENLDAVLGFPLFLVLLLVAGLVWGYIILPLVTILGKGIFLYFWHILL